jgi:fatty-acyl-CoA synthase
MLSGRNIETMTALTLMGYPFKSRPTYLAFAPLTHAAGVLCFPIMTLGGRVVIMQHPDIGEFLDLIARYRVTYFPSANRYLHAARLSEARRR